MAKLSEIVTLINNPQKDQIDLVSRAFEFAETAHKNKVRLSGEPYFLHSLETAKILAEYGMDTYTIAAGLLHDTIEDGAASREDIESEFGKEILFLVEGVTKLGKIRYQGLDRHNESLRKLFIAISQDIRVLMIKLADRLHNMRTLSFVPTEKQKRIASETLEIYAPTAYRLGIRKLSRELEDLSFLFLFPKEYSNVETVVKQKYGEMVSNLEKFIKSVKKSLAKEGMVSVKTEYRVKGMYSLYKKLQSKEKNVEKIYDILAVRIIVETINDCYQALGIVHGNWRPLPGRIKDYIAFPKPNGYQSLHTTVFVGDGNIVEIQIRTNDMHHHCEYGIASHILYKGGKDSKKLYENLNWIPKFVQQINFSPLANTLATKYKNIPDWIKELAKIQTNQENEVSLQNDIRNDFFNQRIFVFTPKGDVIDLPKESSPIDFAFAIHSDVGNHMFGAKVSGKMASLDSKLNNGDIVEILTRPSAKPSSKWLEYAKTSGAKKHIRANLQKKK
ncbi:MAG: hypothetical protein CO184_00065 [Candidatus Zambryskibacteria bacterium CG_4_9_14_3_um_filter_40_16]|uniref:TGS domain-containing protein n=2 Tax=Candidatus Zambryskiibacteriota TaxID=1817925 RepID=A0A2H0K8L8_9BACT|nr:MAG: hypothetical protein COV95_01470 [Candidatus Zambryskibacteria bacterium CG11_big_fil_rev_8_21_14_0_20_40_24]PJA34474.1 MAG: hypothetical protein CO184_00065 [Candidatus Zambryskibacteria bacterium CG_4_9_14_3_um_filter_40_16]